MSMTFGAVQKEPDADLWMNAPRSLWISLTPQHAQELLLRLGFKEIATNGGGLIDAKLLTKRCRQAIKRIEKNPALDPELPAQSGPGGMISPAQPPGYFWERCRDLLRIAEWGSAHGAPMVGVS